jgi:hypothetical protein
MTTTPDPFAVPAPPPDPQSPADSAPPNAGETVPGPAPDARPAAPTSGPRRPGRARPRADAAPVADAGAPDPAPDCAGRVVAMAGEVLALTADRFTPAEDVLDLVGWNAARIAAAYAVTEQAVIDQVLDSARAALAFAIMNRFGHLDLPEDGDLADFHLARLPEIPREFHGDLLNLATGIYPGYGAQPCPCCPAHVGARRVARP